MTSNRLFIGTPSAATALLLFAGVAYPAFASSVSTLAALGANDLVNFSGYALATNITSSFAPLSSGGLHLTVSETSSSFFVNQQAPPGGWVGDFPAATVIIANQGGSAATFTFATPVFGFGLSLDNAYGGGYTATINEYNGSTLLGSFSTSQVAPVLTFLGVLDTTADITSVVISTNGAGPNNYAFSNLSLVDGTAAATAPEPTSAITGLLGLALLAVGAHTRHRMTARAAGIAKSGLAIS
jgi:hypothetical protein